MSQTTSNILLVRPSGFIFNTETAGSNAFQVKTEEEVDAIKSGALREFELFVEKLKSKGVNVFVFGDTEYPPKPDAVFPNNWVTFHPDGTAILYPMYAVNRRYERRQDIIDSLKAYFKVTNIVDLSGYEQENRFLEGTGSMVFDHDHQVAYACLSPRTDKDLFLKVCDYLHYQPVYFHAHDRNGKEIYHTNVMMCIGDGFSVVCLDSITDQQERALVTRSLTGTGHRIIDISFEQISKFAGNMLAIRTNDHKNILALSQSSFDSLTADQKRDIEQYCELVPLSIRTIETIGGGSARCMIAEIFLQPLRS